MASFVSSAPSLTTDDFGFDPPAADGAPCTPVRPLAATAPLLMMHDDDSDCGTEYRDDDEAPAPAGAALLSSPAEGPPSAPRSAPDSGRTARTAEGPPSLASSASTRPPPLRADAHAYDPPPAALLPLHADPCRDAPAPRGAYAGWDAREYPPPPPPSGPPAVPPLWAPPGGPPALHCRTASCGSGASYAVSDEAPSPAPALVLVSPDAGPDAAPLSTPLPAALPLPPLPPAPGGATVATVQFKYGRRAEFAAPYPLPPGECVVVDGDRGEDLGMVVDCRLDAGGPAGGKPGADVRRVRRAATDAEAHHWQVVLAADEKAAVGVGQAILDRHGINVRIVHAEFQFDRRKLTFHFTSRDPKPQVRTALPDLFQQWHCRVWFARYSKVAADREQRRRMGGIVPAAGAGDGAGRQPGSRTAERAARRAARRGSGTVLPS